LKTTERPLQIEFQERGSATVCRLSGSATLDSCESLTSWMNEASAKLPRLLVFDVTDLDFICSMGLGAIVSTHIRAQRGGSALRLAGPNPALKRLLDLTRLSNLLEVHATVDEAVNAPVPSAGASA